MNKEIIKSNQWLMDTLGTSDVPAYEVDKRTLSLLQQIQRQVESNDKRAKQTVVLLREARAQYAAEQRRLETAQKHLGLETLQLSSSAQKIVSSLAQASELLGLDEPSVAGFLLEYSRLAGEVTDLTARCDAEEASLARQNSAVKQLLVAEATLEKQLAEAAVQRGADSAVVEQKLAKSRFLTEKVNEYKSLVRKHESILQQRGYSEELNHDMVLRRHEFMLQKRESLQQLQQKLQQYGQLPADPDLARVKISEMEAELEKLEAAFNEKIHGMHRP